MKKLCLLMFMLISANVFASSDEEGDMSNLSWAHVVSSSLNCLQEDSKNSDKTPEDPVTPNQGQLKFIALDCDIPGIRHAILSFRADDTLYRVHDEDGAVTLAVLYVHWMSNIREALINKSNIEAAKIWKKLKINILPEVKTLRPLLRHAIHRMFNAHKNHAILNLKMLSPLLEDRDPSYEQLNGCLGNWLRSNFDKLPFYKIEMTNLTTRTYEETIGFHNSGQKASAPNTPLCRSLRYLCKMTQFEKKLPNNVPDIDFSSMADIMLIYDTQRGPFQGVTNGYKTSSVQVERREDGSLVQSITYIPTTENPEKIEKTVSSLKQLVRKSKQKPGGKK